MKTANMYTFLVLLCMCNPVSAGDDSKVDDEGLMLWADGFDENIVRGWRNDQSHVQQQGEGGDLVVDDGGYEQLMLERKVARQRVFESEERRKQELVDQYNVLLEQGESIDRHNQLSAIEDSLIAIDQERRRRDVNDIHKTYKAITDRYLEDASQRQYDVRQSEADEKLGIMKAGELRAKSERMKNYIEIKRYLDACYHAAVPKNWAERLREDASSIIGLGEKMKTGGGDCGHCGRLIKSIVHSHVINPVTIMLCGASSIEALCDDKSSKSDVFMKEAEEFAKIIEEESQFLSDQGNKVRIEHAIGSKVKQFKKGIDAIAKKRKSLRGLGGLGSLITDWTLKANVKELTVTLRQDIDAEKTLMEKRLGETQIADMIRAYTR